MLDTAIVILVVAAAFFFTARSLYHTFTGKKKGCSCDCSQCGTSNTCDIPDDKRLL
ncbi:FeoB-associated Cys-rich membrane protein [Desulfoluna butyratoxydans]|uniref:Virus attachment protein p12 family n=1 Tax=Desulfoluna butyratoxydans TaxID=231438 RepID=A0A4V6ILM1_9BACT|nr:FeoB-associated Cys-rich membrane protein [Desulfoluna butyratoxydans]VFQ45618.1 virus attachment protein p12 family [Desulfoluna butyratoxydans]